jgi:cobalt-zinc-cadmium efflux system membrane fusion protein
MTQFIRAALLGSGLLLNLSACAGGPTAEPHEDAHEEGEDHDEHADDGEKKGDAPHDDHPDEAATAQNVLQVSDDLKRDLRVSTVVVSATVGAERVVILGELRAHEDALASVSAPIPSRVARVLVSTGAQVRAGEALVELESVDVGRARATLIAAQAQATRAQAALERKRGLGEIISKADLEIAEAEAAVTNAELRAAEAGLAALGVGRAVPDPADGRFVLRAPIAGTVLDRSVTAGAVIDGEEVLFRLADLSRIQAEAHAYERDAVRLQVGAHADVTLSALPGVTLSGTVSRLGGEIDVASRTVGVRIDLPADPRLRPGMAVTATVDAVTSGAEVVSAPSAALQRLDGGWVVFIPMGADAFEIRPVGRGRDLGANVEVISGLTPGEVVVLDGAFLLKAETEKRQSGGEASHEH